MPVLQANKEAFDCLEVLDVAVEWFRPGGHSHFPLFFELDLFFLDGLPHRAAFRSHYFLPGCVLRHVDVFVRHVLQLDGMRADFLGVGHLFEIEGFWRPYEFIILADKFKIYDAQLLARIGNHMILDPDDRELILA